nr:MAG: GNAT family N-acetyltransferase [Hyphomicrobiales bacterium]
MTTARRVRLSSRLRNAGRRWGFSRQRLIVPRRILFGTRPKHSSISKEENNAHRRRPDWPVLAAFGSLEVRLAESAAEVDAAQRLRYHVFYEEMSATPSPEMRAEKRDFDKYDAFCDHVLVIDRDIVGKDGKPKVVGTYRLLRGEVAAMHGGYYTSSEYDLSTMQYANRPGTRFLELGRSCVLKSHRSKGTTMQLLWKGIIAYDLHHSIDIMFGCGSFPGTDPDAISLQLSYLHHFHRAPEGHRVRARPELYVEMNRMPKEEIEPRAAVKSLPTLIKGYVRAGTYIGDGAVVDSQFGTTDVLIYFPVSRLSARFMSHFADRH